MPDTVATKSGVKAAQTTANAAQTAADNAQSTANAAQTAADNAQSTANAALERVVEPYTRNAQMAPLYKNGEFSDWRSVVQGISYNETEGYFFANAFNITALKKEDMPNDVFCTEVYVERKVAKAFLSCFITGDLLDSWSVSGFAVITEDGYRTGEVLYVSANTISLNEAKGLFLTFRAPDSMLLKSSTTDSTKQFRITVDDAGTLSVSSGPTEAMESATTKYVDDQISNKELILSSSTAGSTKKFKLTIDDTGTLTASEITA